METLTELPFIGDQVGLFKAQPGRPKVPWYSSLGWLSGRYRLGQALFAETDGKERAPR